MDGNLLLGIVLFLIFTNNFVMGSLGLYSDRSVPSYIYVLKRVALSVVIIFSILGMGLFTLDLYNISRLFLGIYAGLVLAGFIVSRTILETLLNRTMSQRFNVRKILIIGSGEKARALYQALMSQKSWGHQVIGLVTSHAREHIACNEVLCLGELDDLASILREYNVDEIIFALEPDCSKDIKPAIHLCEQFGITFRIVPAMYNPDSLYRLQVDHIQGIPTLSRQMVSINAAGLFYKRIMDFAFGLLGLILVGIVYPFTALAIKLESPGPVLFRQKRVGQNGRIFYIYKFRTMYVDAEERKKELMDRNEMQGLMFKVKNDPRITRVGRFLRKTSLDELPQFLNVIKGEMSLVGTRPPTIEEVQQYEPWHRRRISMKPGITGLWQVSGRNKITDFNEVVRLDLKYIDHWSFLVDIKILFQTVWVVLRRKGAI